MPSGGTLLQYVRYVMLTCQCYVTVHIYPRFSHLKSLASYFGLQLSSTLPYIYYSFLLRTSAIQSLTQTPRCSGESRGMVSVVRYRGMPQPYDTVPRSSG